MLNIVFGVVLALVIPTLYWLPKLYMARNRAKLSAAKLKLAEVSRDLEQMMSNGELEMGETLHDDVFQIVERTLFLDRYVTIRSLWKNGFLADERPETRRFRERFACECNLKGERVQFLLSKYVRAYFMAFRYRQPVLFASYFSSLFILLIVFGVALHGLKAVHGIRGKIEQWTVALGEARGQFSYAQ